MDSFGNVLFGLFLFCILGISLDVMLMAFKKRFFAKDLEPQEVPMAPFSLDTPFDQGQPFLILRDVVPEERLLN